MRAVLISAVTLSLVSVLMLQSGCTTPTCSEDAEDKDIYVPLHLTATCAQEITSAEAERMLGLSGPVTVTDFAIGVSNKALYFALIDSQRQELAVCLSQSNYTANLIRYDVSLTSNGNARDCYTCDAADVRFKAFEVVCLHWVNRSFASNDLPRIARAELGSRAETANDIISYFQCGNTNRSIILAANTAAQLLGVSLPVEVTNLDFCNCDAPMHCALIDATGRIHTYKFEHATGKLESHGASVPEPEQREALRVLLCDWCEKAFPRAGRSTRFVKQPRSEEIANRVLAFFRPQYFDPTVSIELLNGKPFTGKVCTYYANGRMKRQRPYVNGRKNGIETRWHENGLKEEEGTLVEDRRNGTWISWYVNGKKADERKMRNNLVLGEVAWYPNGTKKREVLCSDEGAITNQILYYPNGVKRLEEQTPLSGNDVRDMWDITGNPIAFTNDIEQADSY
jgi:hypothetical protein